MSTDAPAQPALHLISCEQAIQLVQAAIVEAKKRSLALSFAVVDSAGHLVSAVRMDGAPFVTTDIARGKAFASASAGGEDGAALEERYRDKPMVWGNVASLGAGVPLLPGRGSLPIFIDGLYLGSMAASGARSEVDEDVVRHAMGAIGARSSATV
jgi:glc operon protein GlcG